MKSKYRKIILTPLMPCDGDVVCEARLEGSSEVIALVTSVEDIGDAFSLANRLAIHEYAAAFGVDDVDTDAGRTLVRIAKKEGFYLEILGFEGDAEEMIYESDNPGSLHDEAMSEIQAIMAVCALDGTLLGLVDHHLNPCVVKWNSSVGNVAEQLFREKHISKQGGKVTPKH